MTAPSFTSIIPLCLALLAPSAAKAVQEPLPLLSSAAQIRQLSNEEAGRHYPVHLRGVVTVFDPDWQLLFVQDASAGIYVFSTDTNRVLKSGQAVEVDGISSGGKFAPMVSEPRFKILGAGALPEAAPYKIEALAGGSMDSQWIEVEGVVRSFQPDKQHAVLELAAGANRLYVAFPAAPGQPLPENLVDAWIQVRGVCTTALNSKNQILRIELHTPGPSHITIKDAAPADPFTASARTVASLLRFSPNQLYARRVLLRGTVTSIQGPALFYIQDASGGIAVQARGADSLRLGDQVEAAGFPVLAKYSPELQDAIFRRRQSGSPREPVLIDTVQARAGTYDSELVQMTATVMDRSVREQTKTLLLKGSGGLFEAVLNEAGSGAWLNAIPDGSIVQVTGICSVDAGESRAPRSFRILLDSAKDVALVKRPTWWNASHTFWSLGAMAAVVLAAVAWVVSLRREAQWQTELIRKQSARQSSLEQGNALKSATFAHVGRNLGAATEPENAARVIAQAAQSLLGWDAFTLDLFNAKTDRVRALLTIDTVGGTQVDVAPAPGDRPTPLLRKVLLEGPFRLMRESTTAGAGDGLKKVSRDAFESPPTGAIQTLPFGDTHRLSASLMFAPVRDGENIVGILSVQSYTPGAYAAEDLGTLQALADFCGGALRRIWTAEELHSSEERFRLIAEAIDEVFWMADEGVTKMIYVSPAYARVWGRSVASLYENPKSFLDAIHVEDRGRVLADYAVKKLRRPFSHEYRIVRPDGAVRWIWDRGFPVADPLGTSLRYVGVAQDITERRCAEEGLREAEERYRGIFNHAVEGLARVTPSGRFLSANPAMARMLDYDSPEELMAGITDLARQAYVDPAARPKLIRILQERGVLRAFETQARRKDGAIIWVAISSSVVRDKSRQILYLESVVEDITERKRAEAEIEQLAAFPRLNPNPILQLDAAGNLSYFNDAALKLAGTLGHDQLAPLMPPDTPALVEECLRTEQSRTGIEVVIRGRTLAWSFFPILPSRVVHAYAVDMTDRLNLEMQLRHAQKLESVGKLAAGLAHDFNNVLTVIQGHLSILQTPGFKQKAMEESLAHIGDAVDKAAHLTRQLLTFSRRQVIQLRPLDINEIVGNVTRILNRVLGENVTLRFEPGAELPCVQADGNMLEQVLMNLIVNARDALPKGGQIVVATRGVEIDDAWRRRNPEAATGRHVCLSVQDNGIGMDAKTLSRIFEPFFTTKDSGKGTGLGLATAYGIVKQHQGWIEVISQLGHGTTFSVYLPAMTAETPPAKPNGTMDPHSLHGAETILLVEDEPALRDLARQLLETYGYHVFDAATGLEALNVFATHGREISLLVTDLVMPQGVNGRELAERLLAQKENLKVIYISGYGSEVVGNDFILQPGINFLPKPFRPMTLVKAVRDCLDSGAIVAEI